MRLATKSNRRRGATTVEMALVSILLFMMLFGIFEYCRLLYVIHVVNNSARDTARFAVVHTNGGTMSGEPIAISASDLDAIVRTGQLGPLFVGSGFAGMELNIEDLAVEIFAVDPAGLSQSPPVIQAIPNKAWDSASFGQKIAVRVSGNYRPVLPTLLFMNSTIPIQITALSSSEAN
ncbi:MAG: pilus assembly protein [Planctomycetes bacterium]|nr:pilus assembly protein [Planctomycetota bacterium]